MTASVPLRARLPGLVTGRETLFRAMLDASEPVEELTVSEWADRHRIVSPESGSPFPGQWSTDRMPHLREPMDCLHPDHPAASVTLKCSAQVGKSEIIVNWFGFIVDRAPGPMMTMLPSLDEAVKFNRIKLQPTIDASPKIRHRVAAETQRDEKASTTSFKRFVGGFNQIVTASSSKGLQMVSIRYMARDEISEYPFDTDGRGDPVKQSAARLKAYSGLGLAKELNSSTPGFAGTCRITAAYLAGDQRRRYVPCPHCGDFQVLVPENLQAPSPSTRGRATFACQSCHCLIDQVDRHDMLRNAAWIATRVQPGAPRVPSTIPADEIDGWRCDPCVGRCAAWQPSYAIWAAYSPLESWTDIWTRGQAAKSDPTAAKSHVQQDLGEAYEAKSDAPDHDRLLQAREDYPARVVPYPAVVLTGYIDVQGNRLEWAVWAWGPRAEGWIIDRGVIPHPPEIDAAWAEVDELLRRRYPTENGGEILVDQWGLDTGDKTTELYLRVRPRRARLMACKGANRPDAMPNRKTEGKIKDHLGRVVDKVPLNLVGNFGLKSRIYQGFANLVAGRDTTGRFAPETLHLCADLIDEDQCKQLTSEVLVDPSAEAKGNARRSLHRKVRAARVWLPKLGVRNEALDLVVGCRALAMGLGVDGYSNERWARLWRERSAAAAPVDLFTNIDPLRAPEAPEVVEPAPDPVPGSGLSAPRLFTLARQEGTSKRRPGDRYKAFALGLNK